MAPGLIALLGSGETAPASGSVYEMLARAYTAPLRVRILETPAGFQPNSQAVAGRVADFLQVRLQNWKPNLTLVAARARGTASDPDSAEVTEPLCNADLIFLGPGSPTYAVRQLQGSLAWQRIVARHRHGAALVTASAATLALGAWTLPVYEIYKVGEDLHWRPGLDFFGAYGLKLAILPHWNNAEGGAELDTSHCFMGRVRYERLLELLPGDSVVLGIDEHTALVIDPAAGSGQVFGRGGVTVIRNGCEARYERTDRFALGELGVWRLPEPTAAIPPAVWAETASADPPAPDLPPEIADLAEARQAARARRDWAASDSLRSRIAALGWQVRDTPGGQFLEPL